MRLDELSGLAPTLSTAEAAEILGVGVDCLWALARSGTAPVAPLRLGRRLRWPTAAVLSAVGIEATPVNQCGS
ncbi:MAG: helix-turn-helix domain-containing protein [Solirubrobacterales bacterium]